MSGKAGFAIVVGLFILLCVGLYYQEPDEIEFNCATNETIIITVYHYKYMTVVEFDYGDRVEKYNVGVFREFIIK